MHFSRMFIIQLEAWKNWGSATKNHVGVEIFLDWVVMWTRKETCNIEVKKKLVLKTIGA